MAGEVNISKDGTHPIGNKEKYGADILCQVCKADEGEKCKHFSTPNKTVYCCSEFEQR